MSLVRLLRYLAECVLSGHSSIVALDIGTQDWLAARRMYYMLASRGNLLVNDPRSQELLQLPATEAGSVMVVKPYSLMSYALVKNADIERFSG